jgi:hypothetical protein
MNATEKFNVIDPFVRKIKHAKDDADILAILTECTDTYVDFVMEEEAKKDPRIENIPKGIGKEINPLLREHKNKNQNDG